MQIKNKYIIFKMSENDQSKVISILSKIFYTSQEVPNTLLPIIQNPNEISSFKSYIEDKNINKNEKIAVLQNLKDIFKVNKNLIPFFTRKYKTHKTNLYVPLIELYLDSSISDEQKLILKEFIKLLNSVISIPRLTTELIFNRLSKYYRNEGTEILNESLLLNYLKLLQIFYKMEYLEEVSCEEKQPKNFFYFNGYNSGFQLTVNHNTSNFNASFPSLENGCSFVFWLNINENLLKTYYKIFPNIIISLVTITIAKYQIRLVIKDAKYIQILIDKDESNRIDLYSIFAFDKWNNICFVIGKQDKNSLKIYINNATYNSTLSLPKNFPFKEKINTIKFFENYIGKVTAVFCFSFPIEQKLINHFGGQLKNGFYKNKILFEFLHSNDNEYFNNSTDYKYFQKFKDEKKLDKELKIKSDAQSIKNMMSCFCPFAYHKSDNTVDDIFGNFIGKLNLEDGVNLYSNNIKNIIEIGGISFLLPILELMHSSNVVSQKIKYNLVDKNILSENTFLEYLKIIKYLLIGHTNNLYYANKNKFFSSLGLFLEKFPSKIYTEKILEILIELGREIFRTEFDYSSSQKDNYINMVLLNEKIFSKFSTENQRKLWENINEFFTSDYSQMKDSLNMSKICLLLRFYDEKRYNEYCCLEHAKLFNKNLNAENKIEEGVVIMNPEMNDKVGKLFDIIQIYVNKLYPDNESVNLYKLLSLDISPCLQKKIINVYISHFESDKITEKKKLSCLNHLLKNNYVEVTEYAHSISLLDVRIELLKLFKIILEKYYNNLMDYIYNNNLNYTNILQFIAENVLPDKLLIELDEKKSKDDKDLLATDNKNDKESFRKRAQTENLEMKIQNLSIINQENSKTKPNYPLTKYFNEDIYNSQIEELYNNLFEWINIKDTEDENIKLLKSFIIDIFILFVCRTSLIYLDNFTAHLFSCFSQSNFLKKKCFLDNNNLYPWLIETIFYYHNNENTKDLLEKDILKKIQIKTLNFFTQIFSEENRSLEEVEHNIQYILNYSYYIKDLYKDSPLKKKEVSRITRILLEKLIACPMGNINIKTKNCFEFIILYKNKEKLATIKNNTITIDKNEFENVIKCDNEDGKQLDDSSLIKKSSTDITENLILENNFDNIINNNSKNASSLFSSKEDSLPSFIYDGLFLLNEVENNDLNAQNDNNNMTNTDTQQQKTLTDIWKDFSLYDGIIDYYCSNIWGIESICKKVNIEYNGDLFKTCELLLKEYSISSKQHRNILSKEILKLLNQHEDDKKKLKSSVAKENSLKQKNELINILNINLILLCIAIEITKDKDQKEYLEKQFQQFLIFCILSSINTIHNERNHDMIQNYLYDIIGFGCLFLQKRDEKKYNEILENLIKPIFNQINEELSKGGFLTWFGQRKILYKNTAVYKLFTNEIEKNDIDDDNNEIRGENKKRSLRLTSTPLSTDFETTDKNDNNNYKDDSYTTVNKKKTGGNTAKTIDINFHVNSNEIINKIFNVTLEDFKNQRNKSYKNTIIKNYYSNISTEDTNFNYDLEHRRINNKIKILIPSVETLIRQYSNTSYLEEKKRRNNYKRTKSRLFSWTGFWSNKYLFFEHPEYLKLKIKNHYTKEMIKPLLSPVLDVNYYLPNFKKFNKNNLFYENNYDYNINLDIDDILGDDIITEDDGRSSISSENSDISELKYIRNNYGFNYLECLYKLNYTGLWEKYNLFNDQKMSFDKKEINFKEPSDCINLNKTIINENINSGVKLEKKLTNEEKKLIEESQHIFKCCIVKPTHHVKGKISTFDSFLQFIYSDDKTNEEIFENLEDDPNYDKDMGSCYGSIFKNHRKDKDKTAFVIFYSKIKYMFKRTYFYKESGLEIFTEDNKSYFLNFVNKEDVESFINDILKYNNFSVIRTESKKKIGYEKSKDNNKVYLVTEKMDDWHTYKISTLEYLMWLNIYSGRSFNDLTQYPVMPWIITDYVSKELKIKESQRNLSLPMGMLEINEKSTLRKETYIDTYESLKNDFIENNPDFNYESYLQKGEKYFNTYKNKQMKIKLKEEKKNININISSSSPDVIGYNNEEDINIIQINQIPYYYGSHYSNPTYISHYLTRIFPFSLVSIEIQGEKFDDPDRLFISMEKTFDSACTLKDDVRELIPEFYTLPPIFRNINNLNLTQNKLNAEGNLLSLNDVSLPPWCNNEPYLFISEMRKYLEHFDDKINKWIDLIFGTYQRGEKAEEAHNIFMAQTYEKMVTIEDVNDSESRDVLMRLVEIGVTPRKILFNDSKTRLDKETFFKNPSNLYSCSKGNFLYDCKKLCVSKLETKNYNSIYKKSKKDSKKEIKSYEIKPKIISIKWIGNDNLKIFTNTNKWYEIQFTQVENDVMMNEGEIFDIENNSSKYASSFHISNINDPIIIYNGCKSIIKAGFWDGRIEINNIPDSKEEAISTCIFPPYSKPIIVMEMSDDEKFLLCGTMVGLLYIYRVDGNNITFANNNFLHSDEITSININTNLNMFATCSKDGYVFLFILPSFLMVRAIKISLNMNKKIKKEENENNLNNINDSNNNTINSNDENSQKEEKKIYANNVFLSSAPLACVVIYIASEKIFRTYTINGEFICEEKESDDINYIKCPVVFKNLYFQDFLIYGTDDGSVKIRKFPEMNLINSITVCKGHPIEALTISGDKRYCYAWANGEVIHVVKDTNVSAIQVSENISRMGFNIGY